MTFIRGGKSTITALTLCAAFLMTVQWSVVLGQSNSDSSVVGSEGGAGQPAGSANNGFLVGQHNADSTIVTAGAVNVLEFKLASGSDCVKPGETVTVELHQRNLSEPARGYQSFASYDSAMMTNLSQTFTPSPYMRSLLNSVVGDDIDAAAGIDEASQSPTDADALLATLTFTAGGTDGVTSVGFRTHSPPTRFSDVDGMELTPYLIASPPIVIDGTDPVITFCPPDVTIECDESTDPSNTGEATATDNLDPNPSVTYSDSAVAGICPQESVITRTWIATDCAGNETTCEQVITVDDSSAPTGTQGTIDSCYATALDAEAAAIAATTDLADNCTATGSLLVSAVTAGTCDTTVTVTVADLCGNSTDFVYNTRIDSTPPAITCPAPPPQGLIISEIMDGTWPAGLPKFVELTNCSSSPVDLSGYSLGSINNGLSAMGFDALVLSGIVASGDSFVVSYEAGDSPGHGTFYDVYGFDPDDFSQGAFINGNDALALFSGAALSGDPVDGSGAPVVDLYGVVGVDGVGEVWDYTDGFSFRRSYVVGGNGGSFSPLEWQFGGAESLVGSNDLDELALMLANTTPGVHACSGGEVVVSTDPGTCEAEVTLTVSATDDCDGVLPVAYEADFGSGYVSISNPYSFPVGTWPVKASAIDTCNNVGSCGFSVTVLDDEPPTATQGTINDCYETFAEAESAAIAATTDLADNCTTSGFTVTASTVGDCNATVTVSVADEAGNVTTFDYFTTVDGTPPDIACPAFSVGGFIISEVIDGTLSGGIPKFVELTNCTPNTIDLSEYRVALYSNGGLTESSSSLAYGELTGLLPSGASFVIANSNSGPGTDFLGIYGFEADFYDAVPNSNGDDLYQLLKDNGVGGDIVIDAHGVLGVDGTGEAWEYLDSYAYSLPGRTANGGAFNPANWFHAGVDALDGAGAAGISAVTTPGTHTCASSLITNADPGNCDALVAFATPTATDNCDPAPTVDCDHLSGEVFPVGTTTVTCMATDECGNTSTCEFDIVVNPLNDLSVTVELQPNIDTGLSLPDTLTRCITFELWECGGPSSVTVSEEIEFTITNSGLPGDPNMAVGSALIEVPCGAYSCITARDPLHTLRRTDESFGIIGSQYVADFTGDASAGGDWLVGGNLNDDFFIDILDFGAYSFEFGSIYGSPFTGDTDCLTPAPHADISGDGIVDNFDFSFIQGNFLDTHEANCCGDPGRQASGDDGPVTEITIRELRRRGLGHYAIADLNNDGSLNYEDIEAFANGARPKPKKEVAPDHLDKIQEMDAAPAPVEGRE
ncbi:MAG: lamin tail domain-containing protein [Phycisphaerales bacterium]|nr:lamin tail domain-containing protein [Phycisphaerales bacterium]